MDTIKITCKGATEVNITELNDLQGNLKDLHKDNYEKLKTSILKYGFSFPVFIWENEGKKWIIDAHQRIRVLNKMKEEGYEIPLLPADLIFADNRVQAKEKLLLLNSSYGSMTNEGLYEFLNEPEYQINLSEIEPLLALPYHINLDYGKEKIDNEEGENNEEVTCPKCQYKFNPS